MAKSSVDKNLWHGRLTLKEIFLSISSFEQPKPAHECVWVPELNIIPITRPGSHTAHPTLPNDHWQWQKQILQIPLMF